MEKGWKRDYSRYKEYFLNIWRVYNTKPSLKIYLELILSLSTVAVFAVFAIKPTVLTIIELNKEISSKEETISKLKQKIKNLQTANLVLQDEGSRLQAIDEAVPNEAATEVLVRQMETLSNQNSTQMISFSVSDVNLVGKKDTKRKAGDLVSLPESSSELGFTLSVTGTYQNLINFLKSIETLRRPLKIDSFLINANVSSGTKVLTLIVSGRVPYLPMEQ